MKKKIYYSIRVVEAVDMEEATRMVEDNIFDEIHPACDMIIEETEELRKMLLEDE